MAEAETRRGFGSDVVYEYVYKSVKCGPHNGNLSALVVTSSGDVYGAGANTLVRCYTYHEECPMQEGAGSVLKKWVKIDRLCGLGIKKIIVGAGYGAALTAVHDELLIWGRGVLTYLGKQAVVMFQEYRSNAICGSCSTFHDLQLSIIGKQPLSYCCETDDYPMYNSDHPPPGVPVKKFLRFYDGVFISCSCMKTLSSKVVNAVPLFYCATCDCLWDVDSNVGFLGKNGRGTFPKSISFRRKITDIAPTPARVWLLMGGNNEILMRTFEKLPSWTQNPAAGENVNFTSLHGFPGGVLAKTSTGELWRVVVNDEVWPFIGAGINLKQICLPSPVARICSGFQSSLCSLADESMWMITPGGDKTVIKRDGSSSWLVRSVASINWCDTYYVQLEHPSPSTEQYYGCNTLVSIINDDPSATVVNLVCSAPIDITVAMTPPCGPPVPLVSHRHFSIPLPPFLMGLYGQNHLSDVTFKLSNEEFPAHRSVLLQTSDYFKKTLYSNTEPHVTLDVSSYNPEAYKCLLKYYYNREPDELDMDSLIDLYVLSDSYGETKITEIVEEELKNKINLDNVLHVFGMSKMLNLKTMKSFCENLMKSSAYKEKLLEKAMQDPLKFLVLLD